MKGWKEIEIDLCVCERFDFLCVRECVVREAAQKVAKEEMMLF